MVGFRHLEQLCYAHHQSKAALGAANHYYYFSLYYCPQLGCTIQSLSDQNYLPQGERWSKDLTYTDFLATNQPKTKCEQNSFLGKTFLW